MPETPTPDSAQRICGATGTARQVGSEVEWDWVCSIAPHPDSPNYHYFQHSALVEQEAG